MDDDGFIIACETAELAAGALVVDRHPDRRALSGRQGGSAKARASRSATPCSSNSTDCGSSSFTCARRCLPASSWLLLWS
ncbi:hypothetical protein KCH_58190 [Kitasatospora cheerisanensis KCTC 2395]|uniref:Uncharacterized protein n=1 Tax=Kitasatospora cheerisanensis KCTC 2395 TaxID=1348663 RepID=A0A066YME2_9ACTN|nr:hypothetical protein KCH_58190 [Kitasatospora cheerisanensis KCTC 2395]